MKVNDWETMSIEQDLLLRYLLTINERDRSLLTTLSYRECKALALQAFFEMARNDGMGR